MKTMKKITAALLSVCMTIGLGATAGAAAPNEMQTLPVEEPVQETQVEMTQEEYEATLPAETLLAMEQQEKPLEAYDNLLASFSEDLNGMTDFPPEYGGSMVEGDQLVISLVNPTEKMKADYLERCKLDTCVTFREVENSLDDLEAARTQANQLRNEGFDVVSTGIDVKNNELVVGLNQEEHTVSKAVPRAGQDFFGIDLFSALIGDQRKAQLALNDLPVRVEMTEPAEACAAALNNGSKGNIDNNSGRYVTIGIGGTYGKKKIFVTCGHGFDPLASLAYSGVVIGKVAKMLANTIPNTTAYGDYAFIESNGNRAPSHTLVNGTTLTSTGSAVTGATVSKYGCSTGYGTGTVQMVGVNIFYTGYGSSGQQTEFYTTGLTVVKINSTVSGGDSGGPVYSGKKFMGIMTAKGGTSNAPMLYFTPYTALQKAGFNFSLS